MRTEQEIRDRVAELEGFLAKEKDVIMRMGIKNEMRILKWVLGEDYAG
jgi:hypothetical protein